MSDPKNPNKDTESIAPAPVTLNVAPDRQPPGEDDHRQQPRWIVWGLVGCGLLLVLVIVALPRLVNQPTTPAPTAVTQAPPDGNGSQPGGSPQQESSSGPTESPWQDAQLAKARRETQELLAKLLDRQDTLEELQVRQWAAEEYEQAQQQAATADDHYQQRDYARAKALYKNSLDTFNQLIERSEDVYQTAIESGQEALADGNSTLARDKFQLAAAIKPDSATVQTGLERSRNLDQVLDLIEQGESAEADGDLAAAKQHYNEALQLDPAYQPARQHLAAVESAIAERRFSRQMSKGFDAMGRDDHEPAIEAFKAALAIDPEAEDARTALRQAQNQRTQENIQQLLSEAKQNEKQAQWQEALAAYERILELDQNLAAARAGKIRTQTRAEIDQRLENILSEPQRLTSPSVHREYRQFLAELEKFESPGKRLKNQIQELELALEKAVEPVTVTFYSDNATHVTLYGVDELGTFEQTQLTLKPGRYTAVGTRRGYRDVRREFTVSADNPEPSIAIQCEEKINAG